MSDAPIPFPRGQLRPGDRVAVDDRPKPNNQGTVEEAWDDGMLRINFDDGGSAPYPASECRRIG
jgi:hypothetical protein